MRNWTLTEVPSVAPTYRWQSWTLPSLSGYRARALTADSPARAFWQLSVTILNERSPSATRTGFSPVRVQVGPASIEYLLLTGLSPTDAPEVRRAGVPPQRSGRAEAFRIPPDGFPGFPVSSSPATSSTPFHDAPQAAQISHHPGL